MDYNLDSTLALGKIETDTEEGVAALESAVSSRLKAATEALWPRALQSFESFSYLCGNHLTRYYWSGSTGFGAFTHGVHDSNKMDSLVAKSADNHMLRAVESVVAMLTSNQPHPRVEPNSSLPEDEDAAELAEIVLELLLENPLNLNLKLRDSVLIACVAGTAIAEVEYGETDQPVQIPKTKIEMQPNPLFEEGDPENEKTIEVEVQDGYEVGWRKDIQLRIWTPFHIAVDPNSTSFEDATWVARTTFEDREWVADSFLVDEPGYTYGPSQREELLEGLTGGMGATHPLYYWHKVRDVVDSPQYANHGFGSSYGSNQAMGPNQTTFTVLDVKPTKAFTQGRTLIFASDKLLYDGPCRSYSEQYPWRWHPYTAFGWFRVPGRVWAISLLSQIVPLQKKINAIDALVHANRSHMAFGQWLIPKSSKIQEGRIGGMIGEQYTYTDNGGGNKPERIQNAPIPAELFNERADLIMAISRIAAISMTNDEVSPSANRAGAMLNFMEQKRLQNKSPMIQDFERFIEGIAQNVLIEIQLNLLENDPDLTQRIQMAAREHSSLSVQAFVGSSLRDHHNVKIDIKSGLMNTVEAKAAKAAEFFQYSGGQVSPAERTGILKAMGLDEFVSNPDNASVERARRIVSRIRSGQLTQIFTLPGESVQAMLPVFVDAILADTFHDLPQEQKNLLLEYQMLYEKIAAAQQQAQMQQMMQMQQLQGGKSPQSA